MKKITLYGLFILGICCIDTKKPGDDTISLKDDSNSYNSLIVDFSSDSIKLEKEMSYYYIRASDEFLGWYEGYTGKIYYQNLLSNEIFEIPFTKGRGPFEILNLRGLEIIGSILYILDTRNLKIVSYDLERREFIDEILMGEKRLMFITSSDNMLYGKGRSQEGIFFEINSSEGTITPLVNTFNEQLFSDFVYNLYRFDGPFIANNSYLVSPRYYETSVVVYELSEKVLNDYFYDETNIITDYPKDEFGFSSAPDKISLQLIDVAFKPNSNSIYIVANGSTLNVGSFKENYIYEYNLEQNEFGKLIKTNAKSIGEVTTNSDFIFIYDDKNFTIKKIKL